MHIHDNSEYQTVSLNVVGAAIERPFYWTVILSEKGKIIYSIETDDTWLNSFFGQSGYIEDCEGYKACKEKWYFNELPMLVEIGFSSGFVWPVPPEQWQIDGMKNTSSEYLLKKGFSPKKIELITQEMQALFIAGKFVKISLPFSPVESRPELMLVPSINEFVPYWNQW